MIQKSNNVFKLIAETGDRFKDFSPYVASVNNLGEVAFQAELENGDSGIFIGNGNSIIKAADTSADSFIEFYSHPDINDNKSMCFYAEMRTGRQAVVLLKNGRSEVISLTENNCGIVGPLGPSINENDSVTFRADMNKDYSGIYVGGTSGFKKIADTENIYKEFYGIPVINNSGSVAYRAKLKNGSHGIFIYGNVTGEFKTDSISGFSDIGNFFGFNDTGILVFKAVDKNGTEGIFCYNDGQYITIAEKNDQFESFRNAFINNSGKIFFSANSENGHMGLYECSGENILKVLSNGDTMFDSVVEETAVNAVSFNDLNQISIRIKLKDGRQIILLSEPTKPVHAQRK
ncbi:MAG: hypothetical protein JSS91_02175 [Bacteroidetes bacterium]|nr:hypothetical protein [Bacteroidota bacterium]